VPEGDTIFRTAASFRTWMGGRVITAARSKSPIGIDRVVGRTIDRVEPNGKHLLVHFGDGSAGARGEPDCVGPGGSLVLQTHMRMTGSWHLYAAGAIWKRPKHQATLVLEAGDRVAVGFNIPIVSLDTESWMRSTPALRLLGPDILSVSFDLEDVLARLSGQPDERALGEVLLDQTIVAGIGNIYRCEALFACRHHPWTPVGALTDRQRRDLVLTAKELMEANIGSPEGGNDGRDLGRDFGKGPGEPNVYRRAGRPCRVCRNAIESEVQGTQARRAYWCPDCQPKLAPRI
jgi:endonuclease VIII